MKHISISILVFFFIQNVLQAQYVPVPAPPQSEPIAIVNATIHVGNGQLIEGGIVAFDKGKITIVSDGKDQPDLSGYQVIDVKGKHLYPGFIATNTPLGLVEIGAVRATVDYQEVGSFNPNVRALIAYNTDSEIIPTVRANGVLLVQTTPSGGRIPGMSSIMMTDGWNWEDAVLKADDGVHLNWPSPYSFGWRQFKVEKNKQYDKQVNALRAFFDEAYAYYQRPEVEEKNLRFEAMKPVFDGTRRLYIHAELAANIQEAVLFAEDYGITPVIVGATDAWVVADFLKAHRVPVILRTTFNLPRRPDEPIDLPFRTPAILYEKGVQFCFSQKGFWQQFNLPFVAGQAVAYGLPYEEAVRALTGATAEILGIADQTGTIEVGKDATLFLSQGDALDIRTNQVTHAFIQGRSVSLDNKHKMLYRKFKAKYEQLSQQ